MDREERVGRLRNVSTGRGGDQEEVVSLLVNVVLDQQDELERMHRRLGWQMGHEYKPTYTPPEPRRSHR